MSEEERSKQVRDISAKYDWDKIASETLQVYLGDVPKRDTLLLQPDSNK